MLRRLRETGPALLVPLAWTFATFAHLEAASTHTVRVGMVVMDVLLVAFTVLSWQDMQAGVLLAWKTVLVVGTALNLLGTVALFADPVNTTLAAVTVVGWMLVPAAGYVYTGLHVDRQPQVYLAGAGLSLLGAILYLAPAVAGGIDTALPGFALVGIGQTAGILAAVVTY
ncbi:hypothetical protein [Haloarchaeobius amylolyticus]|uniref:hypothetical protein n=1 Tax=Haloarchaeobius amylolyticus TaxID=1198296 RepID=UPI002271EAB8|nr:hypothetical protein [Haloarchaeobius amylolyticus]